MWGQVSVLRFVGATRNPRCRVPSFRRRSDDFGRSKSRDFERVGRARRAPAPHAEGGNRTHTARGPPDFESGASASSATSASGHRVALVPGRIGILTGGGDCPGLNAVIRAAARRSLERGYEVVGVREGWRGMTDGLLQPLDERTISGILPRGGTILGTSRTNPYKSEGGVDAVLETLGRESLDALVAIGGEDTLGVAARLHAEHALPVVGVPKTIDNDLSGTD